MGQPMKIWRRNARLRLIAKLGGKCFGCDETRPEKLEFEHKTPITAEEQKYREECGANARMVLNRKEAAEGKLQLACRKCNVKKSVYQTRKPKWAYNVPERQPVANDNEPF
jgi:5-methylcytosine-specific restriction endonuclease McrA